MRRGVPFVVVAVVALVAGCASPKAAPPKPSVITIGAPTPATQKITIAGPAQDDPSCYDQSAASYQDCPDSYADPASWPQACDLISKAQLHQLLPQATDLKMSREDITIEGRVTEVSQETAPGAKCDITFSLPATGVSWQDDDWSIGLSVVSAGGPGAVRSQYEEDLQVEQETAGDDGSHDLVVERHGLGPADCFERAWGPNSTNAGVEPPTLECYRGSLGFTVTGATRSAWPDSGITVTYQGKTSTLADSKTGYPFLDQATAYPLVTCVNAVIP